MKAKIFSVTALLALSLAACSNGDYPVLTTKDWDNTFTYFASSDAKSFETYYKPQAGYVGDPMPFFDPVAKDFKIMYLQEFRPNSNTYHPFWCVSTADAANYVSLG